MNPSAPERASASEAVGNPSPAAPSLDERSAGLPHAVREWLREARAALEQQRYADADAALRKAQPAAGDHAEFLRLLGVTRQAQKRSSEAVSALRRALELAPGDALILTNLGTALRAQGDMDAALVALRRACELAPELAPTWYNLGRALASTQNPGEANEAYARALACDPQHLKARLSYADTLRTLGRSDDAVAHYRQALELDRPDAIEAWGRLANMKTLAFTAEDTARLEQIFARGDLSEEQRVLVGFALVKAREDQGRYGEAFDMLGTVNAVKRRSLQWDAAAFRDRNEAVMRAFARPLRTAAPASMGKEVVFVVSLPRSGSTLIEQILASHPEVEGAGELPDLAAIVEAESKRLGGELAEWAPQATPKDWRRLGEEYLERTQRWRRSHSRFTDKALSNWRLLGAAMAMLPGARFVDARRDALETCLSCYRQMFSRGSHPYSYDLGELVAYWREYDRSMRFWHARYPHAIREQSHEKLLAAPEAEVRALLAFCDLPFDDACLRFHRTRRNIHTLSAAQVREPLRRNTARAPLYGERLAPLAHALGRA